MTEYKVPGNLNVFSEEVLFNTWRYQAGTE